MWAAYLDLEPPPAVVAESLMIRHAGALIAAQAGSSDQVQDLLRSREAIADGVVAERKAAETPIVPVDQKVIAFAKAQAKGGKRRG